MILKFLTYSRHSFDFNILSAHIIILDWISLNNLCGHFVSDSEVYIIIYIYLIIKFVEYGSCVNYEIYVFYKRDSCIDFTVFLNRLVNYFISKLPLFLTFGSMKNLVSVDQLSLWTTRNCTRHATIY